MRQRRRRKVTQAAVTSPRSRAAAAGVNAQYLPGVI